jgi:hypothetical protein
MRIGEQIGGVTDAQGWLAGLKKEGRYHALKTPCLADFLQLLYFINLVDYLINLVAFTFIFQSPWMLCCDLFKF